MSQPIDSIVKMLEQLPPQRQAEARDFVEFLLSKEAATANGLVSLPDRGIDQAQAASLRARLQAFAEDWERPEMGAYDAL